MFQRYVASVRISVAKVHRDVAKVDRDVAHVAMTVHVCFKSILQMFYLYQPYVASIFIWMLQN
jgi:hypothetical protein